MRLLVTSVERVGGYGIVRDLRHAARTVVVTAAPSVPPMTLRSRLYDASYRVEVPRDSWLGCSFDQAATPGEAAYLEEVLGICRRHGIDTVFPAPYDVELMLLARHKAALAAEGITLVAPDAGVLLAAADKYDVVKAAEATGFPHPRTVLCARRDEVEAAARELGYPLVVKARLSTGSQRVLRVRTPDELHRSVLRVSLFSGSVVVQEYVPGSRERSLNYMIGADGSPVFAFGLRKSRYLMASLSTAVRVTPPLAELEAGNRLLRHLGVRGFCAIQTKLDARDGRNKLIEVNPRFGSNSRILFRFGHNLPLMCLRIARGEPVEPVRFPEGLAGVSPVEDAMAAWVYLRRLREGGDSGDNPLPAPAEVARSYLRDYARLPRLDCYASALLDDPLPVLGYYRMIVDLARSFPRDFIPWGDLD